MSFHGELIKNQRLLGLLCAISRRPTPALESTKALHALTITMGSIPNQGIFVDNNIVSWYSSMGELSIARKVFDRMPNKNAVSYNTMISAHSRLESVEEAWNLLSSMRSCGFWPTQFTFGALLSSHGFNLSQAVQLQGLLVKNGLFGSDEFGGTALLGLYGRLGHLTEAIQIFHDMPWKSVVTWNLMLSLFGKNGFVEDCMFLFRELMYIGTSLTAYSITGVLSSFFDEQDLEYSQQMHCVVIKIGFDYNILVVNSLINTYIQCAALSSAERVFEKAPSRDVISWNTIIGAVAKSCTPVKAIQLFNRLLLSGILPSQATFVSLISSCSSNIELLICGESFHAKAIVYAFASDVIVGTAMVNFYSKLDKLVEARSCFSDIVEKNVASWNTLISGCSNNCSSSSLNLLIDMLRLEFRPNEFTFSAVLKSTVARETQQLHGLILKTGFEDSAYVSSSLASAYAKNGLESDAIAILAFCGQSSAAIYNIICGIHSRAGHYDEAIKLQSFLKEPDIVSWNIVIAACARKNYYNEVFDLFRRMRMLRIDPDRYTFVSLLSVCPKLSNLPLVSSIHSLIIKINSSCFDTFVYNLFIDAYGKCGNLRSALTMFEETTNRNTITWTALISSLGINGYAREAMERFREMELLGFEIDGVALLAVLRSCRYGGLVREGMEVFRDMKKYGVEPEMEHYHCVVDLLCKSGEFGEAGMVMAKMPFPPNAMMWRSFVDSCSRKWTLQSEPLAVGVS